MAGLSVRLMSVKAILRRGTEMGIVLEAEFRGQGYAVEALNLLLKYAFVNIKPVLSIIVLK